MSFLFAEDEDERGTCCQRGSGTGLPLPQTAVSSEAAVAASAAPGEALTKTYYSVGNLEEGISPFSRLNHLIVEEEGGDLPSSY